jgi:hypothetical protein
VIRDGKVILPRAGKLMQEFAEHLSADVKQLVEDEATEAQGFRYVRTATDHDSLAFTSECIAASRHTSIDFRVCGWQGYDEDDHWRSNILIMKF